MLEFYAAYMDYTDVAALYERMLAFVASEVGYSGPIDFSAPFVRKTHHRGDRGRDRGGHP